MSLLAKLGLTPVRKMPPPGVDLSSDAATSSAAPPVAEVDAARRDADAMRGDLQRRYKAAYDQWQFYEDGKPHLAAAIQKTQDPNQKAALEENMKKLELRLAESKKASAQLMKDLEAIDNVATSRKDLVDVVRRGGSQKDLAKKVEVDIGTAIGRKPGEKQVTTTTTAYQDGRSMVDRKEETRTWGLGGVETRKSHDTETTLGGNSVRTSSEDKLKISPLGKKVALDSSRKVETESADGKKTSFEAKKSTEISDKGVSIGRNTKETRSDTSSTERSSKGGLERGDGKVGLTATRSTTETDAKGDSVTKSGKASGGLTADAESIGGYGSGEGSVKKKTKGGFSVGAVLGLDANVKCRVGKPVGDPARPADLQYPVTLEVSFGGSLGGSTGKSNEEAKVGITVEGKVSASVKMNRSYLLPRDKAAAYVAAVEAASHNKPFAGTETELAIIRLGVSKGWQFAKDMYDKESGLENLKEGESTGKAVSLGVSGKVGANVKMVNAEISGERSTSHSMQAKKGKGGVVEAELEGTEVANVAGKVGFTEGVVGGSGGAWKKHKTSSGYSIKIDPKNDPGNVKLKALGRCSSQADYDAFARKYPDCVESSNTASDDSDGDTKAITFGEKGKLEIGLHKGVAKKTKRGKDGKVLEDVTEGSAGGGGALSYGDTKVGDTTEDKAKAKTDGEGNAELDLERTKTATDFTKLAKSKLPAFLKGKEDKPKKGAIATLAGGAKEDTDVQEVAEYKLKASDLDAIAKLARNARKWERGAESDWNASHEAWAEVGEKIRASGGDRKVVAHEIATFIGNSKSNRLPMVRRFLRPDGDVSIGSQASFPNSIKDKRSDYQAVVLDAPEKALLDQATKDGPAAASEEGKKVLAKLDDLAKAITAAKDIPAAAVRAEMISAIEASRERVNAALRKIAGGAEDDAKKRAVAQAEYTAILKTFDEFAKTQKEQFAKLKKLYKPGYYADVEEELDAVKQLENLHALWWRDWKVAEEKGKLCGAPAAELAAKKPDAAELERWGKMVRIQGV
jgi:hypothetical protein